MADRFYDTDYLVRTQASYEREVKRDVVNRRKAIRHIASMAKDAKDCALLLEILGLEAKDGKA